MRSGAAGSSGTTAHTGTGVLGPPGREGGSGATIGTPEKWVLPKPAYQPPPPGNGTIPWLG